MTMLTPLGRERRRSRRWPRVLAVMVLLALCGAAAYGVWWWLGQRSDDDVTTAPAPTRTCTTPTPTLPKTLPPPASITLAVENGTQRTGLAVDTADALAARGFVVADVGNTDKPVKQGSALVRFAKGDLKRAVVTASFLPDAELIEVARVKDADVAVWLGPEFTKVRSSANADPDSVQLPPGDPVCKKTKS
jgi:hypothetical protein